MKRTPLRRAAWMKRGKRMRQVAVRERRRPPGYEDPAYLDWLREQACRCPQRPSHPGGDPHHARHDANGASLGANMKDDRRAISLARICHGHIDALTGPFKGWDRATVHAWVDEQIAEQRAEYLALCARNPNWPAQE